MSRRLARNQRVLVASPAYVAQHGMPTSIADLQERAGLIVRENGNVTDNAVSQRFDVWTLHR